MALILLVDFTANTPLGDDSAYLPTFENLVLVVCNQRDRVVYRRLTFQPINWLFEGKCAVRAVAE